MNYRSKGRTATIAVIALLTVILGIFWTDRTQAQQGGTPIAMGDTVEGSLDSSHYQELYALTAKAGDSVVITMRGGGGLDTYLILQDSSGKSLIEDDDSGGGPDAQIKYKFTDSGTFTIVATRSGQQGGVTTGSYTLTVENPNAPATPKPTQQPTKAATPAATRVPRPGATQASGAATAAASQFVDGGEIADGESVNGSIDDGKLYYVYSFAGVANLQLTITIQGQGGLRPSLAVVMPSTRQVLKAVDATAGSAKAILEVSLPLDDTYLIYATRVGEDQGRTHGAFTLSLATTTIPDQVNVKGAASAVMANLVSANLAPKGGKLAFTLPANSFLRASTSGLKYQAINRDSALKNFVLHFQISWITAGDQSGCGVIFRRLDEQNFSLVMLTNDRHIALLQVQNGTALIDYYVQTRLFTPKELTTVTVIAINSKVTLYVNGRFQTAETGKVVSGEYGLQLYNTSDNTALTACNYPTGWVWSFDE